MPKRTLTVYQVGEEAPVAFAAKELARCLRKMAPTPCRLAKAAAYDARRRGIYVGIGDALREAIGPRLCKSGYYRDEMLVRGMGSSVVVSGSNPRSVLFAAYRLLQELGAAWPLPGKAGEYLPRLKRLSLGGLDIHESAAYPHRGVCIEGAVSLEHVLDFIEWMPKARFNAFMLEFKNSGEFYRRWYGREYNPDYLEPRELSEEECEAMDEAAVAAVRQRGLHFHRIGHGWTTECLGIPARGWGVRKQPPPEDKRPLLALVGGKRDFFHGVPANTELCYSNPRARRLLVDHVVNYAVEHPEVDFLHFWLSDGTNNHCECVECVKREPSDWYLGLVKEIAGRLRQVAPKTHLVFLCYSNTLWPPVEERLGAEHDNAVFMFAPITRCYAHRLADPQCGGEEAMQRPPRNKVALPSGNSDNVVLRRMWAEQVEADSFMYEYYLWSHATGAHAGVPLARLIRLDARDWRSIGINGIVSDQTQRSFYPTALAQWVMGEASWNPRRQFEDLAADYFAGAFGPMAGQMRRYLEGLAEVVGKPRHGQPWWAEVSEARALRVLNYLRASAAVLRAAAAKLRARAHRRALAVVGHHHRLNTMLWPALLEQARGHRARALGQVDRAEAFLRRSERSMHPYADFYLLLGELSRLRRDLERAT
jgi:hypothetical protein